MSNESVLASDDVVAVSVGFSSQPLLDVAAAATAVVDVVVVSFVDEPSSVSVTIERIILICSSERNSSASSKSIFVRSLLIRFERFQLKF